MWIDHYSSRTITYTIYLYGLGIPKWYIDDSENLFLAGAAPLARIWTVWALEWLDVFPTNERLWWDVIGRIWNVQSDPPVRFKPRPQTEAMQCSRRRILVIILLVRCISCHNLFWHNFWFFALLFQKCIFLIRDMHMSTYQLVPSI